ncbi:protein-histidine kinase [Gigaspora margarita]|uniref:histidine kinase n=1 Tax=Gigaspora margarita TaxID=4874 RepID=A0A8H4EK32_GIGMA|nr:protein-histidine kinase [Gigaspora margarita]
MEDEIDIADMKKMTQNYDWSLTSLGPIDTWEPLLKIAVNFCLDSRFPFAIYCGPDLIFIYNKALIPTVKEKHPSAFGKPIAEIYPLAPVIAYYEQIKSTGKDHGEYCTETFVPIYRDNYNEEGYFNYSMSAIYKEDGSFLAILNMSENATRKILNKRRLKCLSDLGNCIKEADSLKNGCHIIMNTLQKNDKDIPFALIYLIDNNKSETNFEPRVAYLAATTFDNDSKVNDEKLIPDHLLETPRVVDLTKNTDENYNTYIEIRRNTTIHSFLKCKSWPIDLIIRKDEHVKVALNDESQAVLFPVKTKSVEKNILIATLICGINPSRPLDNEYMEFLQLVVNHVSSILTQDKLREEEKNRIEMLADLNRQKVTFFESISHELRTPLTLMLSPLEETINLFTQEAVIHSHLQIVQRNTRRLLKLVNNLLHASNIETGQLEVQYPGELSSIKGLEDGANDYIVKPFNSRQLIARIHTNINLSQFRYQIIYHRCKQEEVKQLLISISNIILSELNFKDALSKVVKKVHQIISCNRIFIVLCELSEVQNRTMIALSEDPEVNSENNIIDNLISDQLTVDQFLGISTSTASESSDAQEDYSTEVDVSHNTHCIDTSRQVSMLSARIIANNKYIGWIKAHKSPDINWDDTEIELFQQISNQINLTINSVKLLREKMIKEAHIKAIQDANTVKTQILANTSHELRTPLGAIIGILSSIKDDKLSAEQKDMIDIMIHSSDNALFIVNNILNAAKLEAHKITLDCKTFDLFDLLESTIEIFEENSGNKQIELILSYDTNSLPKFIKSDPERLKQILMHLLSNSVKFTKEGEIIMKIFVKSLDTVDENLENQLTKKVKLLFEVSDTGIGINPEFMQYIWESYSRVDTSIIRQHCGTGLGLSISKQLVEINNGEIGAESKLGEGSKFWFTWNVELISIPALSKILKYADSPIPLDETINHILPSQIRLNRILLIHPFESARISITNFLKNFERVGAFDTCDKGIEAAKYHKELYNQAAYDIAFINLYEKDAEEITKAASELRQINGDNLHIVFMIFSNSNEKALAKKLIDTIGGRSTRIFKPITYKKVINQCLRHYILEKDFENPVSYNAKNFINNNLEKFKFDFETALKINLASSVTSPLNLCKKRMADCEIENMDEIRTPKSRLRTISNKYILCVDDNPMDLEITQKKLEELGYSTVLARTGQEAINLLQSRLELLNSDCSISDKLKYFDISIVLMDCIMSDMSGFDTSRAIRSMNSEISDIPIVGLTTSATEETCNKCKESGMNYCLVKPLKIEQFNEIMVLCNANNII